MKDTAVIILNWNGADMMRRFLPEVVRSTPAEEADVIVADNGSTDNSLQVLAEEFPSVKVIVLDKNYGFAEGYNRALASVEHEYAVLLNSDVATSDGWLDALKAEMRDNADVAACQPKILSAERRNMFEYAGACGGYIDRHGYPYCRGRIFGSVEEDRGQYDTPADVAWASGAALMVRRKEYLAAGGLDGAFFRPHGGDRPLLATASERLQGACRAGIESISSGRRLAACGQSSKDVSEFPQQSADALQEPASQGAQKGAYREASA